MEIGPDLALPICWESLNSLKQNYNAVIDFLRPQSNKSHDKCSNDDRIQIW